MTQGAFGCQKQRRFGALTSTLFWGRFVHALWPHGGGEIEEKPDLDVLPVFQELFWLFFFNCLTCLDHVWYLSCLKPGLWHAKLAQLYFEIPKWCFIIVFMFLHGRFPTTQAHPTCTIMTGSHSPSQQSKHFGQTGWANTSSFSLVTTSGIHVYPELSQFFFNLQDQSRINLWISGK